MSQFVIEGGHPLRGTITASGNKNAALALIPACLLTEEPVVLHNLPDIQDVRTALAREVHEETGILGEVVDSIATIDYWFTGTSQRVHKLVHHFALRQIGGELTVEGDPDHEAEDAIWVDFADLDDVLSYPNERKIAWLYARKLNRQG